jgi:hypothetical protein
MNRIVAVYSAIAAIGAKAIRPEISPENIVFSRIIAPLLLLIKKITHALVLITNHVQTYPSAIDEYKT